MTIVLIGVMVYEGDIYLGDVYELEKGLRPIRTGVTRWNDVYVCFGRYIVSCCLILLYWMF